MRHSVVIAEVVVVEVVVITIVILVVVVWLLLLLLLLVSGEPVIAKLSRHNAVSELDAAIDLQHTCGYVTMLRATARRRTTNADDSASPTTSAGDPSSTGNNNVYISSWSVIYYANVVRPNTLWTTRGGQKVLRPNNFEYNFFHNLYIGEK